LSENIIVIFHFASLM